jgi:hypothetical protein
MVEDQPLSRPLAPRLILLVSDIPISTVHTIFLLRLQFCRLSKKLGVLNEEGVYY